MLVDFKADDEEGRLRALQRCQVLDTPEETPFEKIIDLVQQVFAVPMCAVSLVDRHRQWFKAKRGLDVCETAREISFCTHAIRAPEPLVVPDATLDPRFVANPLVTGAPHIRAYAGVPICTPDGYNIGSLCAIDIKPRAFPPAQIAILASFATLVADELELRKIASSDQLTGALSRRAVFERAVNEVERARRYGRPLSVAMIDIDYFQCVNDACGHAAGDAAIKAVAEIGMSDIRQSDVFGRFGGEEFVLLMPETDAAGARIIADRLRERIEAHDVQLPAGTPTASLRLTTSVGVAELAPTDADFHVLLGKADHALYDAKLSGRNRTAVFGVDGQFRRSA